MKVSMMLTLLVLLPSAVAAGTATGSTADSYKEQSTTSTSSMPSCATNDALGQDLHDEVGLLSMGGRTVSRKNGSAPGPFLLDRNGTCSGDSFTGGGVNCFAPWVYCTDARCDDTPVVKDGILVAECLCWMPKNTNQSIIPKETSGAACVANAVNPGSEAFGVTGGEAMCEAMKNGALISTYGELGTKPPARAVKCAPKTPWAWCWGAPCKKVTGGRIICDCPVIVSNYDVDQYVSVTKDVCAQEQYLEEEPCSLIHNGSPAGGSPMKYTPQCE